MCRAISPATEASCSPKTRCNRFCDNRADWSRKIIADVAREQKLMLVFDLASPPLYAEPGPDITDKVMSIYNSKHSN
mgnify:CR=1 FL=1